MLHGSKKPVRNTRTVGATQFSIKNWKGLTVEHLETLLLVDTADQEPGAEVNYSKDNAEVLVTNSTEFDTWLNEVVFDLENFRNVSKGRSPKPARAAISK